MNVPARAAIAAGNVVSPPVEIAELFDGDQSKFAAAVGFVGSSVNRLAAEFVTLRTLFASVSYGCCPDCSSDPFSAARTLCVSMSPAVTRAVVDASRTESALFGQRATTPFR